MQDKKDLKIVFFGTPDFAVCSLKNIVEAGYAVAAVVTSPDKPAGRGYQLKSSPVKQFAERIGLPVLQPVNLKSPVFLEELRSYQAELQIVIAFRMLPETVWNMPPMGTFNLHASYLPAYRGAAPINRAIMNGETETGVTTFFLKHEIDTGNIILQQRAEILPSDNAGSLHDKLMEQGAQLVVMSLDKILKGNPELSSQAEGIFPHAPKIFTEDCLLHWEQDAKKLHNQIRGQAPYPAAFTFFHEKKLKVFSSIMSEEKSTETGKLEISGGQLIAHCADHQLILTEVQPEGKKRMHTKDFLNGLHATT